MAYEVATRYNVGIGEEADMQRQLNELQASDFNWFKFKMPELYAEHGHCYAIVSHKKVVGVRDHYGDAVRWARDELGYGNFIVQEVGPDESAYTATFTSTWVLTLPMPKGRGIPASPRMALSARS